MQFSDQQNDIFQWVSQSSGNGQGRALAGSGKTTTLLESLRLMKGSVVTVAFNKVIADELARRVPSNVSALTTHSFGNRCLVGRPKLNKNKVWDIVDSKGLPRWMKKPIARLVSLMKAEGIYGQPELSAVETLAEFYSIDLGEKTRSQILTLAIEVFLESRADEKTIDFDDMIYMPVYKGYPVQKFDWVAVDEYQDMNRAQNCLLALMNKDVSDPFDSFMAGGTKSRMLVIGDKHQAIYGFRGALNGIMDEYLTTAKAKLMPLNTCYRCDSAIIGEAKKYVPEIEARPGAGPGIVDQVRRDDFHRRAKPGDYVLCRKVAPLMTECMRMIRDDKRAFIRGKDLGDQLLTIVDQLAEFDLGGSLQSYKVRSLDRLSRVANSETLVEELLDRCATLAVLLESSGTKAALENRIDSLFKDVTDSNAVMFSSIHKAKGLESNVVWFLSSSKVRADQPWAQEQERNLQYVAVTRARKELYYVS